MNFTGEYFGILAKQFPGNRVIAAAMEYFVAVAKGLNPAKDCGCAWSPKFNGWPLIQYDGQLCALHIFVARPDTIKIREKAPK